MVSVPSVTTIDGMLSFQTSRPLTAPRIAPLIAAMASKIGTGMPGYAAFRSATIMPDKARVAAIDRSIERVRITTIWPKARITRIEVLLNISSKLEVAPKPGARNVTPKINTASARANQNSRFFKSLVMRRLRRFRRQSSPVVQP